MSAAGDLRAHQGGLRAEAVGVDTLQRVTALVVVAVAGGEVEVVGGQIVLLHGGDDLQLVGLGDTIDGREAALQTGQDALGEVQHGTADAQGGVVFVHGVYLTRGIGRRSGA